MELSSYFILGLNHVLDLGAYDHMLYIAMMLCNVDLKNWKRIIGVITAFTIGHSLSLSYVVLSAPILSSSIVEFLIPITILVTAILGLISTKSNVQYKRLYLLTTFFGLIHGFGFAGFLKSMLPSSEHIWSMLLGFNLGIETAQIIFAALFISLILLFHFTSKQTIQIAQKVLSIVGALISLLLAIQNFPL